MPEIIKRVESLERELQDIKKIINVINVYPDRSFDAAKKWLIDLLTNKFTVIFRGHLSMYFLDNDYIFAVDNEPSLPIGIKSIVTYNSCGVVYCSSEKIWDVLNQVYGIKYIDIKSIISQTVFPILNCVGYTPVNCTWFNPKLSNM